MNTTPGPSALGLPATIMRRPASPLTRIIVGVDDSAGSVAALQWAAAEACRHQAVLRIVSAWEEPGEAGFRTGSPAQIAAARVQRALARVLCQQHYPRHIACATPKGTPGEVLLTEAGDADLLVLGTTAVRAARPPGATGRYCLRRGRGPLVFVPAGPVP